MRRAILALLLLLLAPSSAGATLIPVVADRAAQVSARSDVEFAVTLYADDDQPLTGPGPFVASVDATIPREGSAPLATADQTSDVGAGGVTATGSASARGTGDSSTLTYAQGFGTSTLYLTFDVLAASAFSLDVTLAGSGLANPDGEVQSRVVLKGLDSGQLMSLTCDVANGLTLDCTSRHLDGVLAPDRYDLELFAVTQALDAQSGGQASYDLLLVVPEPRLAALLLPLLAVLLRTSRPH